MKQTLEDFKQTIAEASGQLLAISEAKSRVPREEGKWSPAQIIGHLIDSAANNHARFVRAQTGEDLDFPGYDQEEWVRVQRYDLASWPLLIELWRTYNLHLLHVMASTPQEILTGPRARHSLDRIAWQRADPDEPVTLEYLMRDYIGHLKHHLDQIFSTTD